MGNKVVVTPANGELRGKVVTPANRELGGKVGCYTCRLDMITLPPPRSSYFDEQHECLVDLRPMEMGMMRKTRRGELGGKKKENRMGAGG